MDGSDDIMGDDWGPFGRPIFTDPSARALSRVGVVDVGSNSVRLVVFEDENGVHIGAANLLNLNRTMVDELVPASAW